MITEMEAKREQHEAKRFVSECHKCRKHEGQTDLILCTQCGDNEVCCDCADETWWEMEVCSDRCAANKFAAMRGELNRLRAEASTAAEIIRRGAASYLAGRRVA